MTNKRLSYCLVVFLAACSNGTPPAAKYESAPASTVNLDVLTFGVVDSSLPPMADSPYAKNNYQPTIAQAARQWLQQHLRAVGTTGDATVTIRDASLKSQALSYTKDMFTRHQASKYTGHVQVEISLNGHEGFGNVSAEATRFETLPENPTAIERQNAYTHVLNGLMHDIGVNLDAAIHDHIDAFVVTAPVLNSLR